MDNKINQKELDTIAKIIFGEAWTEGTEDDAATMEEVFKAVANTMRNRSLISNNSIYKEATNPDQYSIYLMPKNPKHPDWADWNSLPAIIKSQPKKWAIAQEMARQAINGTIQDNTGGATYYYNPKVVNPEWAPKMNQTVSIKNHVFLKDPNPTNPYSDSKLQEKLKTVTTQQEQPKALASVIQPEKLSIPNNNVKQPETVNKNISSEDKAYKDFAQKAMMKLKSGTGGEKFQTAYNNWVGAITPQQKELVKEYLPQDVLQQPKTKPTGRNFLNLIVDKFKKKEVAKNEHDQWYGSLAPEGQEVINKYFGKGKSKSGQQPYDENRNMRIIKPVYDVPENILNKKVESRDFSNFKEWV